MMTKAGFKAVDIKPFNIGLIVKFPPLQSSGFNFCVSLSSATIKIRLPLILHA
jgi:hypothetical protein